MEVGETRGRIKDIKKWIQKIDKAREKGESKSGSRGGRRKPCIKNGREIKGEIYKNSNPQIKTFNLWGGGGGGGTPGLNF